MNPKDPPTPDAGSASAGPPTSATPATPADTPCTPTTTREHARLAASPDADGPWRLWGPYLAGRQWGTVREDYSADGGAWAYFPFDQARARAYRWGEDGIGGICDRHGFLNFSVALWNGRDPILKERLFGLTNAEGNHGEDVKEYWWPIDGTPTHSHMRMLYRYPQGEYPYALLRTENARRTRDDREFELADTGLLDDDRFFDVVVGYAKAAPDDLCITISATNHGPDPAPLHVLPQIWFRNTWAWGRDDRMPRLRALPAASTPRGIAAVECTHGFLGRYVLSARHDADAGAPELLVCDNETNAVALFGASANRTPYPKDGIDNRVVHGDTDAVSPDGTGTKAAFWYRFEAIDPGQTVTVRLRLSPAAPDAQTFGAGFDAVVADRAHEADEFYAAVIPPGVDAIDRATARRAFAGLLWGKQHYRYAVDEWLHGDPPEPAPAERREPGARNVSWTHLALADVLSMPDEWEYPWFAAWDLAFHCVALAHVDPAFAKQQLILLCREWSMGPDGQIPAYEWAFSDVNPPMQAWAAWQVYLVDGRRDTEFLRRMLPKLMLNLVWWLSHKDAADDNLFQGGFLGMDNISLFDRSKGIPSGAVLEQSDATSWMAFFCAQLLAMALELAPNDRGWDDVATTFLQHFLSIARAMDTFGSHDVRLWDDRDAFFYDVLVPQDGAPQPLRVRSMVGLLPLLAVASGADEVLRALPDFAERLRWLQRRRPDEVGALWIPAGGPGQHAGLSLVGRDRLPAVLSRLFDEDEFLSPFGVRALSAAYRTPFTTTVDGSTVSIDYEPGESRSGMFGGNSNWRGPVWFPVNTLLIDALRTHHRLLGDGVTVEVPTGSGRRMTLRQAADELERRLIGLFRPGTDGRRPSDGQRIEASDSPLWREHVTFSEYFDGDTGEGLGATHQTGWTALVAHMLCHRGRR